MATQIQPLEKQTQLQTTVNPHYLSDTFVPRQAHYVGSPKEQYGRLAKALSSLEPSLNRFAGNLVQQDLEEQLAEGVDLFQKNQKAWKEFVTANPSYTGANPHLVRGYKSAEFKAKGKQFETELMLDLQQNGSILNETDPEKVSQYIAGYSDKWYKENVGDEDDKVLLAEALTPALDQARSRAQSFYLQNRVAENVDAAEAKLGQLVGAHIEGALSDFTLDWSNSRVRGSAVQTLGQTLTNELNNMVAAGLPVSKANAAVLEAVTTAAEANGDSSVLDVLDHIQTGSGMLGGTAIAKHKRDATERSLFSKERERLAWEHTKEEREKKETGESLLKEYATSVLANPNADVSAHLASLSSHDPSLVSSAVAYRNAVVAARSTAFQVTRDSQLAEAQLSVDILEGKKGFQEIIAGVANGALNPSRVASLIDMANKSQENRQQLADSAYSEGRRDVYSMLGGKGNAAEYDDSDPSNIAAYEGVRMFDALYINKLAEYKSKTGSSPDTFMCRQLASEAVAAVVNNPRYGSKSTSETDGGRPLELPAQTTTISKFIRSKEDFLKLGYEYDPQRQDNKLDQIAAQAGMSLKQLLTSQERRWGVKQQQTAKPEVDPALGNFEQTIREAAAKYGVSVQTMSSMLMAENGGKVEGVSNKGASGIAQFMPATAAQYGVDPNNPYSAIPGAARYLSDLTKQFGGDEILGVAAYNMGPGALSKWLENPSLKTLPKETRKHIEKVFGKRGVQELEELTGELVVDGKEPGWKELGLGAAGVLTVLAAGAKYGKPLLEKAGFVASKKAATAGAEEVASNVGKLGMEMTDAELRASEQIPAYLRKKMTDAEYSTLVDTMERQVSGADHAPSNEEIKVLRKFFGAQRDMHTAWNRQAGELAAPKALPAGETRQALPAGQGFELVSPEDVRQPQPKALPSGEVRQALPASEARPALPSGDGAFTMVSDEARAALDKPEFVDAYLKYLEWAAKQHEQARTVSRFATDHPYAAQVIQTYFNTLTKR